MNRPQRRSSVVLIVGITTYLASQAGLNLAVRAGVEPADDPVYAEKFAVLAKRAEFFGPGEARLLILGSSRTQHGVDAARLARALAPKVNAFNFGTPAAGPLTNSLYLRRLLAAGVRAETLLVEMHPGYLAEGDPPFEARWLAPARLRGGEAGQLRALGYDVDDPDHLGGRGWLCATSLYRAGLTGRHAPGWLAAASALPLGRPHDKSGYSPGPELNPKYRGLGLKATRRQYDDVFADYRVGGPGVAALARIASDARAAGIAVRYFVTPEDAPLRAWYGDAGNAQIAALTAELGAADGRDWLEGDDFVDGHHTTPAGAAKLTDRLAAALAPWPGGAR